MWANLRRWLALFACAAAAQTQAATEWKLLAAQPDAVGSRIAFNAERLLTAREIRLNAQESLTLYSPEERTLMLIRGPARVTLDEPLAQISIHQGDVALLCDAEQPSLETAIVGAAEAVQLDMRSLAAGRFYFHVTPDAAPELAWSLAAPGDPWVADTTAGQRLRLDAESGEWRPAGSLSELVSTHNLRVGDAVRSYGIHEARRVRLDVQQRLVLNLLEIDPNVKAQPVLANVVSAKELRVVQAGAGTTAAPAASANTSLAVTAVNQGTQFGSATFPFVNSPAGLATGGFNTVDLLARVVRQRTDLLGGQGLGLGGSLLLGVGPFNPLGGAILGPGSLIAPGSP